MKRAKWYEDTNRAVAELHRANLPAVRKLIEALEVEFSAKVDHWMAVEASQLANMQGQTAMMREFINLLRYGFEDFQNSAFKRKP